MPLKLHAILVRACGPKACHESIEHHVIADDERAILNRIDKREIAAGEKSYTYGAWADRSDEMDPEDLDIYDKSFSVIGRDASYLEKMLRLRGEFNDEDASYEDGYYGITHYGWDEGREITEDEAALLVRLGVAQDWRGPAEGSETAPVAAPPLLSVVEAAQRLNGSEYRCEGSPELFAEMKAAGLVAVFGASDDLVELRGAIFEELGPSTVYVTPAGLLANPCDEEECPHFLAAQRTAATIEPIWEQKGFDWIYETKIPHQTFIVQDDGHNYCRGIVFALADVPVGG